MVNPLIPFDDAPPAAASPEGHAVKSPVPEQVRVMIDIGDQSVEKSLTARRRLSVVMDSLIPTLEDEFPDMDFATKGGAWTLAVEGGTTLSRRRTLAESKVIDGDRLMLKTVFSEQVFKPIIEEISDALQEFARRRFKNFNAMTARGLGLVGLVLTSLVVAAILLRSWAVDSSLLWWLPPAVLLTLSCIAAALSARKQWRSPQVAYVITLATMPMLFVTGFVLVPPDRGVDGQFTAANILVGAVLVAIGSAALGRALRIGPAALSAICAGAIVTAIASGLFAFTPLTKPAIPVIGVIGGLFLASRAPRWARRLAGIRSENLPPPGEEIDRSELDRGLDVDTFDDESTTELARSNRDTVVEGWALAASKFVTGLYVAAAATSTVAALCLIQQGTRYYWGEVVVATLAALTCVLRARTRDDAVHASIFYCAGFITAAGVFVELGTTTGSNAGRMAVLVAAVVVLVSFTVAGLLLPGRKMTAKAKRNWQWVHQIAIVVMILVGLWVTRFYAFMREVDLSFIR